MNDAHIPDPFESLQQYNRFNHLDLPELDDFKLEDEFHYLLPLLWNLEPDNWLRERVSKLKQELAKRRIATVYKPNHRQTPNLAEGVNFE